jgi:hypothetical protein
MTDHQELIVEFGIYRVYVGYLVGDGHELLVTFDHKGVHIREVEESDSGELTIKEIPYTPEFALTCARAQ